MKHKKIKGLVACTAVTAILAGNITAYAAGGSTTITVNVPVKTDYTMAIPATTTVDNYGWTELNGLKISGTLAEGDAVFVTITSQNDRKFVNQADDTKKIPYELRTSETLNESIETFQVTRSLLDQSLPLGVLVSQDDWNAVPGGTYSDILIFTAQTVRASN